MFQSSMRRVVVIGALVAAPLTVAVLPATAGASPNRPSTAMGSQTSSAKAKAKTIVGIAAANPDFSTLVTAVKQAGLVDALNGKGPYTVFAPTNDAFAKIPAEQLNALLADKAQLTAVLEYHVLKGRVPSSSLKATQTVPTLEGGTTTINVADGKATITDGQNNVSSIVMTDVKAKNGVIHVIDTVLLPAGS
jgi:uncharacterized surface protein with fasciclin (FAS1) repeats